MVSNNLDAAYIGEPFVYASPDLNPESMDYAYIGEPFVSNITLSTRYIGPFPTFRRA